MFFLKIPAIVIPLLFLSCAKIQYVYDQGLGQMSILKKGIYNELVLNDPKIPEKQKDKIKKIEKYKKYFFDYFQKSAGPIYSKTTFLSTKPVSHMVVVSPYNKVEALDECFWLVGCFPYLSFFEEKKAMEYADTKSKEGLVVFTRPVYAYSTLNYFTDTILSSFFYYDDEQLAELIFHELFHTLFFIKGDVDLSENLAQYFGQELQLEFFKVVGEEKKIRVKREKAFAGLRQKILLKIDNLNKLYEEKQPAGMMEAAVMLESFLKDDFYPEMENFCQKNQIDQKDCFPIRSKWNNASFAAYMTYEKNIEQIRNLHEKTNKNLKDFFEYLVVEYEKFKKQDAKETFAEFLFQNE
ncbi:MAG: hypothetical protein A2381_18850 [Bdellovibrionales bacterium RIFOXYB1_FULL_37_110]